MTNNTHTGNTLNLNVEFDQDYWDSMTETDRRVMISVMMNALAEFEPVKKITKTYTAKTWQRVTDQHGKPAFERQSDQHGYVMVAYDAAYLRYQARSAMTGNLISESVNSGSIASGDSAEEVMDIIDAGWDN